MPVTGTEKSLLIETMGHNGSCRVRAGGHSMLPSIRDGDTVCIESLKGGLPAKGDVVAFFNGENLILHRVVKGLLTRGDRYFTSTRVVAIDEILGKVLWVERNGERFAPERSWRSVVLSVLYIPYLLFIASCGQKKNGSSDPAS